MLSSGPRSCDYLGESQLLIRPWTLLPPGWAFNRDVFCTLRNGNSQSFLSQRTQRKQKAKSQAWRAEPLFGGPSWERDGPCYRTWSLGHMCDRPPLHCCQGRSQAVMLPVEAVLSGVCVCLQGSWGARDKTRVKRSCLANGSVCNTTVYSNYTQKKKKKTVLSPEASSSLNEPFRYNWAQGHSGPCCEQFPNEALTIQRAGLS